MKSWKKLIYVTAASSMLLATACSLSKVTEALDDPVVYENAEGTVNYNNPFRAGDGEETNAVPASKVVLHYHNDDKACLKRRFYTWVTGVDGVERKPDAATWTETDMSITLDFSVITEYADMPSLMFIIKVAGTWAGQSEDIELSYLDFPPDANGVTEVWTIPGEGSSVELYKTEAETKFPKILTAKFSDWKTIHCEADEKPLYYRLYAYDKNYLMLNEDAQVANKQFHLFKTGTPTAMSFDIKFNYTAKINVQYVIESEYGSNPGRIQRIIVSCENLYKTERFEKYYTYNGDDLGVIYSKDATTFKVWSPVSAFARVNIYNNGIPKSLGGSDAYRSYEMSYVKGGVWTLTIDGMDLKNKFYTYTFIHSSGEIETIDPYAKACGLNGIRGYIYDIADTNPEGWDKVPVKWDKVNEYDINSPQDLSVYEVHIRDLTMDSSWVSKQNNIPGTYNAFVESGTEYTGKRPNGQSATVKTGFDHLKELGVKAVQLLPVFDNDNDERPDKIKFNWGYNPLNYNCVEGGYSSDPTNPLARIREYKNLIMQFADPDKQYSSLHQRIVMDVVYNHVASASSSCFTKSMPKYYFRYTPNWEYFDGSGCNNEVATDATMMRKYIVDSLVWWATEYKIKGFRFDLMGLIDSWTMRAAKEALYALDPDIYIYGEGWTSGGYHGKYEMSGESLINGGSETALVYQQLYASSDSPGYVGAFNDIGRNGLKGSNDDGYNNNPYPQWGFISQGSGDVGNKSEIVGLMMQGITGRPDGWVGGNPAQTVNYVSCHDNYTLWDQLRYTLCEGTSSSHSPITAPSIEDTVAASIASHGAVMMSNGIGFMQGGEELYRTKTYPDAELQALKAAGTVRPYPEYPHYSSDPDVVIATSDVVMYGKVVCHNSYKASDALNSFKWDRKIAVDGYDTLAKFDEWKSMIATRTQTKKYSYPDNCTQGTMDYWAAGEGSTALALWNSNGDGTGYYFVLAGRGGASIGIGLNPSSDQIVFGSRSINLNNAYSNYTLNLPSYTFLCIRKG